jgi:hypothetical protein
MKGENVAIQGHLLRTCEKFQRDGVVFVLARDALEAYKTQLCTLLLKKDLDNGANNFKLNL